MHSLATVLVALLLAVSAISVELFRYRYSGEDGGQYEAGAANLSEEQISQWIDDRRFPVLEFDYVYWTICPANELNSTLASWAREINDRLIPEVRANITKLSTIRIVPREKPDSTGQ
jgi:hypothetical protein